MSHAPVNIERRGPVAVLSLHHGRANALDVELCGSLLDALNGVERDGAEAVVLTGSGSIFSAGVDLRRVLEGGAGYVRELLPLLRAAFERLALFERPVVAAVNGHAIAGGFILLAAADQALMVADRGTVGVTELQVGVPFPAIALELVRRRVAGAGAARLVYRAGTIGPAEALARGAVDELVEADALLDRAVEVAAQLAAAGPAFALAKRQLGVPLREAVAGAGAEHELRVDELWQAEPTLAAMRRYAGAVLGRTSAPRAPAAGDAAPSPTAAMFGGISGFLVHFKGLNRRAVRDFGGLDADAETWLPPSGDGEDAWDVGQIVAHVAMSRLFFARAYRELRWHPEPWSGATRTRADWVAALDGSAARLHEMLEGTPDDWLGRPVPMLDGRPVEGWRVLLLMLEHDVHHRAQVQTYAGLYGWGSQHIYGRSAEEVGLGPAGGPQP
jgi:enoyl-CoA hydratase